MRIFFYHLIIILFIVRNKNSRKGRNPQTGQEILLAARKVLTFKPSLVLKNQLNEEPPETAGISRPDGVDLSP